MHALQIKNLKKTYDNGYEAIKGIDLDVQQGDFFALLGVNGAGKSTTIGLISHLLEKSSGEIIINGYHQDEQLQKAKACLGIVPQEFNLPVFETCEEILLNVAGYYGIRRKPALTRAKWLMNQLGLEDKMQHIVYRLSGGMKRRLMIARSLMHQPKLLLLDEPSAGVDIEIRQSIWDFLKTINQDGTSIILTTHYLEEAEQLCKNLAVIHHGRIVEKTSMKNILDRPGQQSFIFNCQNFISSDFLLQGYLYQQIDGKSFEIILKPEQNLNQVFQVLSDMNIQIISVQPKTNRLEALFMEIIKNEL